jgi:hypothetical protein
MLTSVRIAVALAPFPYVEQETRIVGMAMIRSRAGSIVPAGPPWTPRLRAG